MSKILTALATFLFLIGIFSSVSAQQMQVLGTVLDNEGKPIKFATVLVVGTAVGTSADEQGKFKIQSSSGQKLQISATGYQTSVVTVGSNPVLSINLVTAGDQMEEVVVAALGLTRSKKALGYAVQELKGSALVDAAANNIVNTLSGKIAGAQVTSGGSTVGSSARIVIRGNASFAGNQPLWVIDGTPIDNTTTNLNGGGGIDWGNAASDIDPNDIESMTVLKGANAAALYGSRATNGVILITTKKGSKSKGIGVDFNSSVVFNVPGYFPEYQNEYGGGRNGEEFLYKKYLTDNPGSNISYNEYAKRFSYNYKDGNGGGVNDGNPINWGPRLDAGLNLDQWSTGPNSPWVSRPDNYKDFYNTEITTVNSIAVNAGSEKATGRFAYTNQNTPVGIVPNTDQKQNTFNTSLTLNPSSKLSIVGNFTYLVKTSKNIPISGYNGAGLRFPWTQRDLDTKHMRDQFGDGVNNGMFPTQDNIFYTYNNLNGLDRTRGFGNLTATYQITDWMSAMVRGGTDFYSERRKSITLAGTKNNIRRGFGGQFTQTDIRTKEDNLDFILNFDKKFGDFRVDGLIGANYRDNRYSSTTLGANDLTVPDLFTISNVKGVPTTAMFDSRKTTNSVFGAANLSYKDYLFLGVTGRNDWSSTLPEDNRSYFYPSFSVGFIATEAFNIKSDFLSFAKLRASWAKVGGDTDPYQLARNYTASAFNSISLFAPASTLPPADLQPEETRSYEFGANLRFLRNRLSLDVTYYSQTTVNQIISVATSPSTGYTGMRLNAGEIQNTGIEVMFAGKVLESKSGFNWDVTLNWATNENVVNKLYGNLQSFRISSGFGGALSMAIPGQDWGTLWGLPFVRDAKSGKIVVGANGIPLSTNVARSFGTVTPDWIGGINNSFRYKNFSLSFLIDSKMGGNFFSTTAWHAYPTGSYKVTTANNVRETGIVLDAVKADGSPNTTRISAQDYFGGAWVWNNHEYSVLDGSYVKLREVIIGYNVNVRNISWLQKLHLSVFGRNLAILYQDESTKKYGIDPEVGMGGGDEGVGFENFQVPTTRNYGFRVSVGF